MNFQFSIFPPKADPPRADNFQKKTTTFLVFSLLFAYFAGYNTASASMFTRAPNNFGLVGYWSMEDGKGATVTDFSGRRNTGTMTNMDPATDWVTGKVGKALDFDGTNDYVTAGTAASTNLTSNLSIFAWMKATSPGRTSIATQTNGCGGYGALNGCFGIAIGGNTANRTSAYIASNWRQGNTSVNDGNWHHVGYTLDSSYNMQFYFDGATDSSLIANAGGFPSSGGPFVIGSDATDANYYTGSLDEVRVYNRVLTSTEVATLYGQSKISKTYVSPLTADLAAYWNLDETSGNRADSKRISTLTDNNSTSYATGIVNNAADFEKDSGNYLQRVSNSSLRVDDEDWSLTAWVKPESQTTYASIATKGYWEYGLWLNNDGGTIKPAVGMNTAFPLTYSSSISNGSWSFLAATYDHVTNVLSLSVNAGTAQTASTGGVTGGTGGFVIGMSEGGWLFDGLIDEVGLWKRVLSTSEISQLYNSGSGLAYPFSNKRLTANKSSIGSPGSANLVLWHTFDGPYLNTTTSTDRSANGYNGTLSGGPVPVLGKVGQAMKFDATNDYIDLGSVTTLTSGSPFSISWWEKINSDLDPYTTRFSLKIQGTSDYFIAERGNDPTYGPITWGITNHSIKPASANPSVATSIGVWHHFVITGTDPTSGTAGNYSFYSDGVSLGTTNGGGWAVTQSNNRIGYIGQNYPTNATIDDFRIYNKVLSASEVSALYVQGGRVEAPDTIAPTISAESKTLTDTCGSATYIFYWTTSESSNTTVEYGLTASYGSTASTSNSVTSHNQSVSFTKNTLYYYRVKSVDAAGNTGYGAASSFTTSNAPCSPP
jgi:hypothetical protein